MNQKMVSANEYKEITKTVAIYVEALRLGSVDMLADVFHRDAVTFGTVDGALVGGGGGNPAADFITANGKSSDIESHIDVLDITPTTAVVRIIMEKDAIGSDCNENMLLVKGDEGWTVVAKVFHQFDM